MKYVIYRIVFAIALFFKRFGMNFFCFLFNFEIESKVSLKKTLLYGKISISKFSVIIRSTLSNCVVLYENVSIVNCTFNGIVSVGRNSSIKDSEFIGDVYVSDYSIINGAKISGTFKSRENLKLFGPNITISGNVEIGKYTSLNGPNLDVFAKINKVRIGSFCSIARNVTFQEYNHRLDRISTYYFNHNIFKENCDDDIVSKGDIVVEDDVWIGAHCVIVSGAYISIGSVIAANSVVSGFVPPYAIVGGSPARIIKYRFDEETIRSLITLNWTQWDIDLIKNNKSLFQSKIDVEALQKLKNIKLINQEI